jgi:multimeric flavodoxin WrbA
MKTTKIVAVLGSPRLRANSSTLARAFLDGARERGAEIKEYVLNSLDYQGCQGCGACKTESEVCVQEDDLSEVLNAVKAADFLVLASPVYFGDISGQLKCFFDRTFSFFNADFSSRLAPGKKAVLILAQAQPEEEQFSDIFPRYERWLKFYGFDQVHQLRAVGVREPGEVSQQPQLLEKAAALAREMMR